MITDKVVIEQLTLRNGFQDVALMNRLEEKLDLSRHLDEPPKPLKLKGSNKVDIIGTAAEFRAYYSMNYDSTKADEVATIDLSEISSDAIKTCDYSVFVTLKSLILLGVTKSNNRALACRKWFMAILGINAPHVTKGMMYSLLESRDDTTDYYSEVICESIIDCTCSDDEQLRFHIIMKLYDELNKKEMFPVLYDKYKGLTPYEFDKEIDKVVKEARKSEYYIFDRNQSRISIAYTYLFQEPLTVQDVVSQYVSGDVTVAIIERYGKLTPKAFITEANNVYMKTYKKLAKRDKVIQYLGDVVWNELRT